MNLQVVGNDAASQVDRAFADTRRSGRWFRHLSGKAGTLWRIDPVEPDPFAVNFNGVTVDHRRRADDGFAAAIGEA